MEVRELLRGHQQEQEWDEFVHAASDGTFFHLSGWRRILEEGTGHTSFYLVAYEDEEIAGVLPLAQVKSLLFGNALISTPFCVYGGVIARDDNSRRALEQAACDLADKLRVDYLELRNRRQVRPDWPGKDLYVTFRKEIAADDEANLLAIPKKQRAMVRKGIKNGLNSEFHSDLGRFYAIYSESVHNLGTPVFSRRYFAKLAEVFGDQLELCSVMKDDEDLAAVMSCKFRDEILPYYGGSISKARKLAANDFMYWEVMRSAADRGTRIFDYGRSKKGTGSYRFKKHWGFEAAELSYEYYLVKAKTVPNLSPSNPKFRFFITVWRKLPLWLANILGPFLARHLG